MPNITTTKISVSVLSTLYYDWSYQLEDCFLKRDAFLEHLIRTELPHIRADLAGKANSPRAKEYITRSLRMLGGEKSLPIPGGHPKCPTHGHPNCSTQPEVT